MGVVTVKSSQITNRDALPRVPSNSRLTRSRVLHCRDVVTIANGDSVGSRYIVCSIPSNAIPVSLRASAPDIGTTTAADIGLYDTTANGGAVVSASFFNAATVLNAGAQSKTNVMQGNVISPDKGNKTIWELLGLAADPSKDYDVCLTLTGAADAAGSVTVELDYVQ